MPLNVMADFFTHNKEDEMAPIEDYIKEHLHLFRSEQDVRIAGIVAHLAGCRGSIILMAAMEELIPLSSASSQARVEGKRERIKRYLKPVEVRACGGQSQDRQPFLNMVRFNIRTTQEHVHRIDGLFHVTTEEAFASILAEGIMAGVDLSTRGRGRTDIHLLIAHPLV